MSRSRVVRRRAAGWCAAGLACGMKRPPSRRRWARAWRAIGSSPSASTSSEIWHVAARGDIAGGRRAGGGRRGAARRGNAARLASSVMTASKVASGAPRTSAAVISVYCLRTTTRTREPTEFRRASSIATSANRRTRSSHTTLAPARAAASAGTHEPSPMTQTLERWPSGAWRAARTAACAIVLHHVSSFSSRDVNSVMCWWQSPCTSGMCDGSTPSAEVEPPSASALIIGARRCCCDPATPMLR